jgi:hypothetical protein
MAGAARRAGMLVLLALALGSAGCLAAAVGAAAAGGAAAGYLYYKGALYRDYPAGLADSQAAVHAALADLQLPLVGEEPDADHVEVTSRTGDGSTIKVYLEAIPSRIPAEGPVTRISVRVGLAGDEVVSARVLDQVSARLTAPPPPTPASTTRLTPVPAPPSPVIPASAPPQTPPPPLADPAPQAKK